MSALAQPMNMLLVISQDAHLIIKENRLFRSQSNYIDFFVAVLPMEIAGILRDLSSFKLPYKI